MRAISRAHASTRATSFMRVNVARVISVYDTYYLGYWMKKLKKTEHQIEYLIIFLQPLLTCR